MRTIRITLDEITRKRLEIGYMGENEHTQVVIACGAVFAVYPNAVVTMTVDPPTGDVYPATVSVEDNCLIWEVTDGDLAHAGDGSFQLTFIDDEEIIKTAIGSFSVKPSLVATGEMPDPVQNWIDNANAALANIPEEVKDAAAEWLDENITNPDSPPLDRSLTSSSAAAPADMVGDIKSAIDQITGIGANLFDPTIEAKKYYLSPTDALNAETLIPSLNAPTTSGNYSLIMKAIPVTGGKTYAFPSNFVGRLSLFKAVVYNNAHAYSAVVDQSGMIAGDNCLLWTAPSAIGYIAMHLWKSGGVTQEYINSFMILEVDDVSTFEWPDSYVCHGIYVPTTAIKDYDIVGEDTKNSTKISAMDTASASDAGKFLKAKTVVNGHVTEWEFDKVIDDTAGDGDDDAVWSADKVSKEIKELNDDVKSIADFQMLSIYSQESISGTRLKSISVDIPAGSYYFNVGDLTTSDQSDQDYSVVTFLDAEDTTILTARVTRNEASSQSITLSTNVKTLYFYAKTGYQDSDGITFTYTDVRVLMNTEIHEKVNQISKNGKDIDDIFDYQNRVYMNTDVSGTKMAYVDVAIPKGTYKFKVDSITSEDTLYDSSRILFRKAPDTTLVTLDVNRASGYNGEITFEEDIVRIYFFASHSNAESDGKDFEFKGVYLSDITNLYRSIQAATRKSGMNNPYNDVIFESPNNYLVAKLTTHSHCTNPDDWENLSYNGDMDAYAVSNYYPSYPTYTFEDSPYMDYTPKRSGVEPFGSDYTGIQIPNAEQHSFTNMIGMHANSLGSMFQAGTSDITPVGVNTTWENAFMEIKRKLLYKNGGGITINHPNASGLSSGDIVSMLESDDSVLGIEIYNGHYSNNALPANQTWAVKLWDDILTRGIRCWGFAVPDHRCQHYADWTGIINVFVKEKTQKDILEAIRKGAFYAQVKRTNFAVTDFVCTKKRASITVNTSATIKAIANGEVIASTTGTTLSVNIPSDAVYIRFEATVGSISETMTVPEVEQTVGDKIFTNPVML